MTSLCIYFKDRVGDRERRDSDRERTLSFVHALPKYIKQSGFIWDPQTPSVSPATIGVISPSTWGFTFASYMHQPETGSKIHSMGQCVAQKANPLTVMATFHTKTCLNHSFSALIQIPVNVSGKTEDGSSDWTPAPHMAN